jgi:3-dehydroquinate dehydratase/shikimate dehydrogenase
MIVTIIPAKNCAEVLEAVHSASHLCDAFELRLDYFSHLVLQDIQAMKESIPLPIIFTLRPASQGGLYCGDEQERLFQLMQLGSVKPDFIDIEHTVDGSFIEKFHLKFPDIKIIRSHHNVEDTPTDLNGILMDMIHPNCSLYKIVTTANSSVDNLRILRFVKDISSTIGIAAHCMGELGVPSRILGPIFGSALQYVSLDDSRSPSPAPGCISLKTCIELYRGKELNSLTKIYALLGDPVVQSTGHLFHNEYFKKFAVNAVYAKFRLKEAELSDFFENIKDLPFKGFSITMPLKRDVLPFINHDHNECKKIGALNTLRVDEFGISGINTDGVGALDAVEKMNDVSGKKILILGAGGSARAIAFEAKKRGASSIIIINRTVANCDDLVKELGCLCHDFNFAVKDSDGFFDFVINTLPFSAEPIDELIKNITPSLSSQTVFMDINYHAVQSKVKDRAIKVGCKIVDGYEMFREQAFLQQKYWA